MEGSAIIHHNSIPQSQETPQNEAKSPLQSYEVSTEVTICWEKGNHVIFVILSIRLIRCTDDFQNEDLS